MYARAPGSGSRARPTSPSPSAASRSACSSFSALTRPPVALASSNLGPPHCARARASHIPQIPPHGARVLRRAPQVGAMTMWSAALRGATERPSATRHACRSRVSSATRCTGRALRASRRRCSRRSGNQAPTDNTAMFMMCADAGDKRRAPAAASDASAHPAVAVPLPRRRRAHGRHRSRRASSRRLRRRFMMSAAVHADEEAQSTPPTRLRAATSTRRRAAAAGIS